MKTEEQPYKRFAPYRKYGKAQSYGASKHYAVSCSVKSQEQQQEGSLTSG